MCVENLTFAEAYYYEHNPIYRQTLREYLLKLKLPLRMPRQKDGSVTAFTRVMRIVNARKPSSKRFRPRKWKRDYER